VVSEAAEGGNGVRVVVAGYYGFGNLGDELILSALAKELRTVYPDPKIVVLSHDPAHTQAFHSLPAVSRWNPFAVFWQFLRADLFVLGGGGLIQDKTSHRSLLYYLSLVALARLLLRRVFLYRIGVESLNRSVSRVLTRL
jgi:polysaccharide pyruvyl transferase WcaK-like protein